MNKATITLRVMVILVAVLSLAYSALADPVGASVTTGTSERAAASSAGQVSAVGGNVTEVNVTGYSITSRWAGFWGEISGGIRLADASSNIFYEWTVTNVTDAVVYAANATVSSWSGLAAANESTVPSYLVTAATDNFTNTFNQTEAFTNPGGANIANTPFTTTWQSGSQGSLKTYALTADSGTVSIWAGKAISDTSSFKSGQTVDYQILAPATTSVSTYYFYVELP